MAAIKKSLQTGTDSLDVTLYLAKYKRKSDKKENSIVNPNTLSLVFICFEEVLNQTFVMLNKHLLQNDSLQGLGKLFVFPKSKETMKAEGNEKTQMKSVINKENFDEITICHLDK